MINKINKNEVRTKRHLRVRNKVSGTAERPRLNVYRSTSHIYAQIIDDTAGNTLVSSSTIAKGMNVEKMTKVQAAEAVGKDLANKALKKGITEVVFDRGGYLYTGRVKALADGAREAGLKF
jgi:large subunit ribosomal protein L18